MFGNYLKIALRNLRKNRLFSFINIAGLAIGMAACILILFLVHDELTFDRFFSDAQNIYQINKSYLIGTEADYNPSTPFPLAAALRSEFAEVRNATNFHRSETLVRYNDKRFTERNVCNSDSAFFSVFAFEFIRGSARKAFQATDAIVITEEMATKYFGDIDPIGQILNLDNRRDCTVSGVIRNIPTNSSIRYDLYIQIPPEAQAANRDNWGSHYMRTFALLSENASPAEFNQKLAALAEAQLPTEKISFTSFPLPKLHLYALDGRPEGMRNIYFFSIIAAFILIIACINFMNLSTARASIRAKEVGMRKVVGAGRRQIVVQFLGESVLQAIIALVFAFLIVELVMPAFNQLTFKTISFSFSDIRVAVLFLGTAVLTGLLAGWYPALHLSSYQPVKILKGTSVSASRFTIGLRQSLVVIQFSIATLLLICSSILYLQNNYIRNKELGFNQADILYLSLNHEISNNFEAARSELLQYPDVLNVARCSSLPSATFSIMRGITWEGKQSPEGVAFGFASVDFDYFNTLEMKLLQGRPFAREFPSDSQSILINRKAAALLGGDDIIGRYLILDEETQLPIIGVLEDFNALPLNYAIEPMVLTLIPDYYRLMMIKIHPGNIPESIRRIETTWNRFTPDFPFEYHFLDEQFDQLYRNEIRMAAIFKYFVILAFFISCLGLFGMASFTAVRRRKEIGIRKVQGATVSGVTFLLSKEFAKWVLISNLFAWPIAYFAMNKWLQQFAYRMELTIWPFLFSGVLTLTVALMTVSYQTVKAATANPVESLRYE